MLTLDSVLFSVFINNYDYGIRLEDIQRNRMQNYIYELAKWEKDWSSTGTIFYTQQTVQIQNGGGGGGEGNRLGNSSARRDAGVTVNDKLSMSQQRHIVVKIASVTLRYRTRSKDFETWINPLVLQKHSQYAASRLGHCSSGKCGLEKNPKGRKPSKK